MATLIVAPGHPEIDFEPIDIFYRFSSGTFNQVDSSTMVVTRPDNYQVVITGFNLYFNQGSGQPFVSGMVYSVELVDPQSETIATFSGLSSHFFDFFEQLVFGNTFMFMQSLLEGNDSISGGDGNDYLYAGDGNNTISGGGGNDYLLPGVGNAELDGGEGFDWLIFDHDSADFGLNINLATGVGTGPAGPTNALKLSNIEGVEGFHGADTIIGSDADNHLRGEGADDLLSGGLGNDAVNGGSGNDTLAGNGGNDTLQGSDGDDVLLLEGEGDDLLNGGEGFDTVNIEGLGGYTFHFANTKDSALVFTNKETGDTSTLTEVEAIFDGTTTHSLHDFRAVNLTAQTVGEDGVWSYKLPEGAYRDGTTFTVTDLDGKQLPSWISFDAETRTFTGKPPANFNGSFGIKVAVNDLGIEKVSTFNLAVAAVNDAPTDLTLNNGSVTENAKFGQNAGHLKAKDVDKGDELTFELVDTAEGRFALADNDRVVVADPTKIDYEQAASHTIKVKVTDRNGASVTQSFIIEVMDVGNEDAVGGSGKDVIKGGKSRDKLNGGEGDDRLFGGDGLDVLTGGKGKDAFVFSTKAAKTNKDKITDFNVKDDAIYLENSVFTRLGKKGSESNPFKLKKTYFANDKAKDKDDYIVYNKKVGVISYDADGSGKGKAVEIASVTKGLSLKHDDFFVI